MCHPQSNDNPTLGRDGDGRMTDEKGKGIHFFPLVNVGSDSP